MQVTSIRFERELIDQLKSLAGQQGYQSLVRDVLWDYVRQHTEQASSTSRVLPRQIRATLPAEAQRIEYCALTGQRIEPDERMWLGFTTSNELVPLSQAGFATLSH